MKVMFDTFDKLPDLSVTPEAQVDFEDLHYLTETLKLDSDLQTYELGLWMRYAYRHTG
jgi:hypothetical protein